MTDARGLVGLRDLDRLFLSMKVWDSLRAAPKPLPAHKAVS
jgi:hypothetical protein